MPIISIIVPIFNRETLLPRCIDSILNQSFIDFELILVNDGSTDNSAKICNEYAKLDSRIKVIHKENGGVSSARNSGIQQSRGEFIMFCDSDDYVEKQWIEYLYTSLSDKISLAICSYCGIDDEFIPNSKKTFYELSDVWEIIKNGYLHVPWNKIYDAKIIKKHNLQFNENFSYAEDMLFCLNYFEKLEKGEVVVEDKPTYRQCDTPNSLSRKKHIDNYWEVINLVYDKIDLLLEKYSIKKSDIRNDYFQMYFKSALRAVDNVFAAKTNFFNKYKCLKNILNADRTVLALEFGYSNTFISKRYYNVLRDKNPLKVFIYKFLSKLKNN